MIGYIKCHRRNQPTNPYFWSAVLIIKLSTTPWRRLCKSILVKRLLDAKEIKSGRDSKLPIIFVRFSQSEARDYKKLIKLGTRVNQNFIASSIYLCDSNQIRWILNDHSHFHVRLTFSLVDHRFSLNF